MATVAQRWIAVGALVGAMSVALGAYGAHGLERQLVRLGYGGHDMTHRLADYETAVRYQMFHAVGIVLTGLALERRSLRFWRAAAWAMLGGVLLFSGLLYVLAFAGPGWQWLGMVIPIGGAAMIGGWLALALGALTERHV